MLLAIIVLVHRKNAGQHKIIECSGEADFEFYSSLLCYVNEEETINLKNDVAKVNQNHTYTHKKVERRKKVTKSSPTLPLLRVEGRLRKTLLT
jgi:hypothetical protein